MTSQEIKAENKFKPTISFAYSWGYGFKNNVDEFSRKHSDEFNLITEENIGLNHKQKILIDLSSNTLPDIFCFWSYETNLRYIAENGYLLDINEYFNNTDSVSRSDFFEESLGSTNINGVNYAIPHERFLGYFAVNKTILQRFNIETPRTLNELTEMAPVLGKEGIVPLSMGSFRGDPGHLFFSALTYQHPKGYEDTIRMKDSGNFIYEGTREASEAVIDLVENNALPENSLYEGSYDKQMDLYNRRKAASVFAFTWSAALFNKDIADETVIIPVPLINNDSRDTSQFTIGGTAQSICINKKSWYDPQKREALIKVLDWLCSDEVFIARMKQTGAFPTKKISLPVFDNSIYEKIADYEKSVELYGIHEFYFNSLNSFNNYKEANDLLWGGAITATDFLNMVQDQMDKLVNE